MPTETPHPSPRGIPPLAQPRLYRIELRGHLDQAWLSAFAPLSFSSSDRLTTIEVLADQAGLRGILNRLWDLNLDLRSVVEISRPAA